MTRSLAGGRPRERRTDDVRALFAARANCSAGAQRSLRPASRRGAVGRPPGTTLDALLAGNRHRLAARRWRRRDRRPLGDAGRREGTGHLGSPSGGGGDDRVEALEVRERPLSAVRSRREPDPPAGTAMAWNARRRRCRMLRARWGRARPGGGMPRLATLTLVCLAIAGCGDRENACTRAGGTIVRRQCCTSAPNFPNTCAIGACSCSPANSAPLDVCQCPAGECFDGEACVTRQGQMRRVPPRPNRAVVDP
jgi:hypothetical protein